MASLADLPETRYAAALAFVFSDPFQAAMAAVSQGSRGTAGRPAAGNPVAVLTALRDVAATMAGPDWAAVWDTIHEFVPAEGSQGRDTAVLRAWLSELEARTPEALDRYAAELASCATRSWKAASPRAA